MIAQPHSSQQQIQMEAPANEMHGFHGEDRPDWAPPVCVNNCGVKARLSFTEASANEWTDEEATLASKVRELASMIRGSSNCLVYTGAGISVAAGISDYATKSTSTAKSVTESDRPKVRDWKKARPTYTHRVLTAMHQHGLLQHWLQQNHDSLPQKAGFPQHALNEIHGSLHDPANPVVPYEGTLRDDLYEWMQHWQETADLCVAMGTSLSGFNCDSVPARIAAKSLGGGGAGGGGLVLVNLQQTSYDDVCALRIFAKVDDVMALLAKELGIAEMVAPMDHVLTPIPAPGSEIEEDLYWIPFDEHGEAAQGGVRTMWDLRPGRRVRLTGGPYEGDEGEVLGKNEDGHYRIRFSDSVHPMFRGQPGGAKRAPFSLWLGNWFIEEVTRGHAPSPGGKVPFVNVV